MKLRFLSLLGLAIICLLSACQTGLDRQQTAEIMTKGDHFNGALNQLTDVIVHDIFSPPVASRVYAYPCIAAYSTIQKVTPEMEDLGLILNGYSSAPDPKDTTNLSYEIAALEAFFIVGKQLIFSEDMMDEYTNSLYNDLDSLGISATMISNSKKYGRVVADHVLAWADKDNYKQSRSFTKFTITDNPAEWKPTPPAYMEGIEPHWREIRTMVLDSANQYLPAPPIAFDPDKNSPFYDLTLEVYEAVKDGTKDQIEIASFWDCNPYVMNQQGHLMFATKKITPGGHWMGIAGIASRTAEHNLAQTIHTATYVSIGLFEAFIACWDEKYRSNLIRPETVINEFIDEEWVPLLQTPPFPEHTSGHSVASTAAATILTVLMGQNFGYRDDVEVKYGLPARSYNSFEEAAEEASISRLYGGIHYMPAITEGIKQGKSVGTFVAHKLKATKI